MSGPRKSGWGRGGRGGEEWKGGGEGSPLTHFRTAENRPCGPCSALDLPGTYAW
jgi:hypothetical protein